MPASVYEALKARVLRRIEAEAEVDRQLAGLAARADLMANFKRQMGR